MQELTSSPCDPHGRSGFCYACRTRLHSQQRELAKGSGSGRGDPAYSDSGFGEAATPVTSTQVMYTGVGSVHSTTARVH